MTDDSSPSDEPLHGSPSAAGLVIDAADQMAAFARARPAATVVAGATGGAIGLWLAGRQRGKGGPAAYGELIPMTVGLLRNPVVRDLLIRAVVRSLSKRSG